MDLNLNKREFKDAVNLRCDWQISDVPNQGGGGLIQPPMPGLTFMHGVFGLDVTGFHIL